MGNDRAAGTKRRPALSNQLSLSVFSAGKGYGVRRWIAVLCMAVAGLAAGWAQAPEDEAARANALYTQGKRVDALPLYEDLAKAHPNEWIYQERLADCLGAKATQLSDPAEVKALRARVREAARRAVELGDPNYFVQLLAKTDPDAPVQIAPASPGGALLQVGEKAFTAGDYSTALAKYAAAADADPQLYFAPLFAGDTAYEQRDMKTAAKWFARAVAVDPNRETAYRYWGDALFKLGSDRAAAKEKFIDAIVAEPYNKLAWQGLQQWAQRQQAVLLAPKIERPAAPVADPKKPGNITINLDPGQTDDKQHPGASAWLMYSLLRAGYRGDEFKKHFPGEKTYRHSLQEEDSALSAVVAILKEKKIPPEKLDESLRNLVELSDAGMLDCWILINAADQGIARDYDAYRQDHRQLLRDYLERFVAHGGAN
jgi:tetratricopeptide (TPR) repeat protein